MDRIYLDNAATTPVRREVMEAMIPYFTDKYGNPSSIHSFGREVRRDIDLARERVAAAIGASPEEIVFTAGGSEADNMAIKGAALAALGKKKHVITSAIEHHAVLETADSLKRLGFEVTVVGVDEDGLIDPEDVRRAIRPDTFLVSIMHANNEIGTIQPIEAVAAIAHEAGALFHTDAAGGGEGVRGVRGDQTGGAMVPGGPYALRPEGEARDRVHGGEDAGADAEGDAHPRGHAPDRRSPQARRGRRGAAGVRRRRSRQGAAR